ncbi:MAG: four helix bundle protein [Bacteroidales bacterium]|jgi:four helix bundle protein|nr:four helix bundle protein [Bacteroidales bacterium]
MQSRDFKDLVVWRKAMNAARETYVLVKKLPREETYALSDQMRRCAVSIPSNIAEGQQRNSKSEFNQFLGYAQGSRAELQTQLLLAKDFGYLTEEEIEPVFFELEEIGKMLYALTKSIGNN